MWAAAAVNVSNSRDLGAKKRLRPTLLLPVKEGRDAVRAASYHVSGREESQQQPNISTLTCTEQAFSMKSHSFTNTQDI